MSGTDDDVHRSSPTGPRVAPPRPQPDAGPSPADAAPPSVTRKRLIWSLLSFTLLSAGVLVGMYRDLSRPDSWAYWKDQYVSPQLVATVVTKADLGNGARARRALAVSGQIGPAAASWFRSQVDQARLAPGDLVLLASPGGDLVQALIMGEAIRSLGLDTAVGIPDAAGRIQRATCASACVLAFAGGRVRYGVAGSALGVHRFVNERASADPVADTQRVTGTVLGYVARMGVSSALVEAMSNTREIRWLDPAQALAMNLVTKPLAKP